MPVMLAEGATSVVGSSTFDPIIKSVTDQLTVGNVAAVIGTVVAAGIGFVFLWWGARKCVNAISSAFKNGKIRF